MGLGGRKFLKDVQILKASAVYQGRCCGSPGRGVPCEPRVDAVLTHLDGLRAVPSCLLSPS